MKSPLHELHEELGATFTEFEGHTMPLQYTSIKDEHLTVRHAVGVFDVSHMGNLYVQGPDAFKLVSRLTTCNPEKVPVGMGFYTAILQDDGTIIDDEVFLHTDSNEYLFVPNAGRHDTVEAWFKKQAKGMDITLENRSSRDVILAVQGPQSMEALSQVVDAPLDDLKLFACTEVDWGDRCILSRTGYTGERGFELYVTPGSAGGALFRELLQAGEAHGIKPIGLGARDTLRLEKGFALAGNEFAGGRTPIEAGMGWAIHWDHAFIGKAMLEAQKDSGHDQLMFLRCTGRGIPRHGHPIEHDGEPAGMVTSGTFSPCLKTGIAMAYISPGHQDAGEFDILVNDRRIPAMAVKPPFVGKGDC